MSEGPEHGKDLAAAGLEMQAESNLKDAQDASPGAAMELIQEAAQMLRMAGLLRQTTEHARQGGDARAGQDDEKKARQADDQLEREVRSDIDRGLKEDASAREDAAKEKLQDATAAPLETAVELAHQAAQLLRGAAREREAVESRERKSDDVDNPPSNEASLARELDDRADQARLTEREDQPAPAKVKNDQPVAATRDRTDASTRDSGNEGAATQAPADVVGALIELGGEVADTAKDTLTRAIPGGRERTDAGRLRSGGKGVEGAANADDAQQAGVERWIDRDGNAWERHADGTVRFTDRDGDLHHPPGVDESSAPDRVIREDDAPGALSARERETIVLTAEKEGNAASPGQLRRAVEEHRLQLSRLEEPGPLDHGDASSVKRLQLWALRKVEAERGLSRGDLARVEPTATNATPDQVGSYAEDRRGNIVHVESDKTWAVTDRNGMAFTAKNDGGFVLQLPAGGGWEQDKGGNVTATDERGETVVRNFGPDHTYEVTTSSGDRTHASDALLQRSLWQFSAESSWSYSLPLHVAATSPDGKTQFEQVNGHLFATTPLGFFVSDRPHTPLTPVSPETFDRRMSEARALVKSRMAATGRSRSEIEAGKESHMFDRADAQLKRAQAYYGYAPGDERAIDPGHRLDGYDPLNPALDAYFLRKEDLEPEAFGKFGDSHEYRGVAKILRIKDEPTHEVTQKWNEERRVAHPVVSNYWFPEGEAVRFLVPITSETREYVQFEQESDVRRSPLGTAAAGVSEFAFGVEHETAMNIGRFGVAAEGVAGAAARTLEVRSANEAISSAADKSGRAAVVGEREPGGRPEQKGRQPFETIQAAGARSAWTADEAKRLSEAVKGFAEGRSNVRAYVGAFDTAGEPTNPAGRSHGDQFHGGGIAARTPDGFPAYMVRLGSGEQASQWGAAIFSGPKGLENAIRYARSLHEQIRVESAEVVRPTMGIPDEWPKGGISNWTEVQVVKVSPTGGEQAGRGVAFWRGTIAPQHEWGETWSGAGREGATVPGGGPQVLLDPAAAERGQLQVIDSFRLAPTGLPNRETKGEIDHH